MKAKHIAVKDNGVSVRIYVRERMKGGKVYVQYDVVDYADGVRKFISFADEKRARAKAHEISARIAPVEFGVLKLVGDERTVYETAAGAARDVGVRLDICAIEYADAKRRLGPITIAEAVAFYLKQNPTTLPPMTVEDAKDLFLKAKAQDGLSAVYLKDLDFRLGKFAEVFNVQLASVSAADMNKFLRGLDCGSRSRNNYRLSITTMIKFCERAGYLHKGAFDAKDIDKAKEVHEEIETFSPQEISKLLLAAKPSLTNGVNRRYAEGQGLLPLLLLGAFAGLRSAEIERLDWAKVNLTTGYITLDASIAKTNSRRLVPITANLKAWLMTCRKDAGLVCNIARTPDAIRRLATRAGITWKHNALRHSFISYRVAATQNVAQVALEAGNSPRVIFSNYLELVTPAQAAEWFAITPANVFEKSVAKVQAA